MTTQPIELLLETIWSVIHIVCRTYNRVDKHDIKYLKCFFYSIFYIYHHIDPNFTRHAMAYMHTNDVPPQDDDNNSMVNWSINFRNYMSRQFNLPEVYPPDIHELYAYSRMYKTVWGPPMWELIHMISAFVDITGIDYDKFKAFITCLQYTIPCVKCKDHFVENLKLFVLDRYFLNNDIFQWSVDIHNNVNTMIDKPTVTSIDAYRKYYNPLRVVLG
jgi:hypothetical protein